MTIPTGIFAEDLSQISHQRRSYTISRVWFRNAVNSPFAFFLIIILSFGLIYAASLTFVYVDGDNATAILYHAFGRNEKIWSPYSSYQGMSDTLLSFLPANELNLRIFTISISALAGIVFTVLALFLIFDWLEIENWNRRAIIGLITLLAFPELFFLGLIYNPALIAMVFVIGAHLLARKVPPVKPWWRSGKAWILIILSSLLFGFGVSLRWIVISYGLVVAVDLILYKKCFRPISGRSLMDGIPLGIAWGLAALLAALFFIALSGQWNYLVGVFVWAKGWVENEQEFNMFSIVGLQSLVTPVVILLTCFGIIRMWRSRLDLFMIFIVGLISIFPLIKFGAPKHIITFIPLLMMCAILGLQDIMRPRSSLPWFPYLAALGMIFLLLAPWMAGIKLHTYASLWGPGFEMRRPGDSINAPPVVLFNANILHKSIPITDISVVVNDGMALETTEGPRPFGAYGAILLGGRWRTFVSQRDGELQNIIQWAITQHKPMLIDGRNSVLFAKIIANGYRLVEPPLYEVRHQMIRYTFEDAAGKRLIIYDYGDQADMFTADRIGELVTLLGDGPIPLVTEYSSTLQQCFNVAPQAMEAQGPFTALVDLQAYLEALQ